MSRFGRSVVNITLSLTALVILTGLGGCGYKDRPVPPQQVVPKAIADLRYQLSEKGVSLYWSYPIETVTGDDISYIDTFEMFRAVVPVDDYCENCPIPFGQPIRIPGGALPNEGRKTAGYDATLLRPGNLYFFKVRSKTGWWAESPDSNIVSFLWNTPAAAPQELTAVAGDTQVELRWQPVKAYLDGTPVSEPIKYQVYRSLGGGSFEKLGKPMDTTRYTDKQVINSRTYQYKVQAISMYEQGTVGGGSTKQVTAAPVDRTAPAVPDGVRAIKTAKAIKVFWNKVDAKDLKGYRVYRRVGNAAEATFVGKVDVPYNIFIDTNPPQPGATVHYSVSSIDTRSPGNESERSKEVKVRR